jgi:hypothetical protein
MGTLYACFHKFGSFGLVYLLITVNDHFSGAGVSDRAGSQTPCDTIREGREHALLGRLVYPCAYSISAIDLAYNDILSNIHQTACQVA